MTKLSVAMIAHNEEKNLARSLPSLQFADELIVVENDSTDQTVAVAKAHGARVISHPWQGYAQQRNLRIAHTSGDWVLIVDDDEVVSPPLAAEIETVISRDEADGYKIPMRDFIAGGPINHGGWYPDYHLRLVRRSLSHYQEAAIHESIADPERI